MHRIWRTSFLPSFLSTALTLLLGPAATAGVVNYNEATDGELSATGPLTSFLLGTGSNVVSGTTGSAADGSLELDSFGFIVSAGKELVSASISATDAVGNITLIRWRLRGGSDVDFSGPILEFLVVPSTGQLPLTAVPLGAGNYAFEAFDMSVSGLNLASSDYAFTMNVRDLPSQSVPEPATLLLVATALLGVVGGRRHGRRICR